MSDTIVLLSRKQKWALANPERHREYQRTYQQQRYISGSRNNDKKQYYLANKTKIANNRLCNIVFRQYLAILLPEQ